VITLDVSDLVLVASRVLELDTSATLDLLDLAAAERALGRQPSGDEDPAVHAAMLLHALVVERPFRRGNRRVALMAMLQLLALNGCDVELDRPEATEAMLADVAAGALDPSSLAGWLAPRLRPHDRRRDTTKEARMQWFPKRRRGGQAKRGGLFTRFTRRARQAVTSAQEEARFLNHNYVGTEHILLGLLREGEGVAAKALESLGISLEAVRTQVVELIGEGQHAPTGHIPFTPRAKKVLELSLREALQLGHNYIGTEHILLGLIREGEGVAAQVLVNLGADHRGTRDQVLRMLAGPEGSREDTPSFLRAYDDKIAEVRRQKDAAIDEGAWDRAAALRDTEKQLLTARAQHERQLATGFDVAMIEEENQRLHAEVERLRGLLRQHGIEPDEGAPRTA
jgi:prophage maintenance system killer protein